MTDVTRTEFQRDRYLEAECMMLEADSLPEAQIQYEEECHPYSTNRIMDENYKFDDDEAGGEDIEESLSYHVFMLESAGFFDENERFWADACEDLNLPDPKKVARRLLHEINKYDYDSNPELNRARKYVTRAIEQQ